MGENKYLSPFLKWPGGKKWLVAKYGKFIPEFSGNYYEPFLGGGSVFFRLLPTSGVISDINEDLINLYIVMRDHPIELKGIMSEYQEKHSVTFYYTIRESCPITPIEKAGRLLYLNRTCYNGMYRVNRQGRFNVPIGSKSDCTYDLDLFPRYSAALKTICIRVCDFSASIEKSGAHDFIFVDPPYSIAHNQNSFIKYNENLFNWNDQKRLVDVLCKARSRGASIMVTNANYDGLREMYRDNGFYIQHVDRYCAMAGVASKRRMTQELLITSFPLELP